MMHLQMEVMAFFAERDPISAFIELIFIKLTARIHR